MSTRTQSQERSVTTPAPLSVSHPAAGLVRAVVVDVNDGEGLGRVEVRIGGPDARGASLAWARVVRPLAAGGLGAAVPLEVGQEVLIGFLGGDIQQPVVLGGLSGRAGESDRGQGAGPARPDLVGRVIARAEAVLGNRERAEGWLHDANLALGGVTPLSLLDAEEGADRVETILGRIEWGVYS